MTLYNAILILLNEIRRKSIITLLMGPIVYVGTLFRHTGSQQR